jgi:hypothetical protein
MLAPLLAFEQFTPPGGGSSVPPTFIQSLRTQTNHLIHLLLLFGIFFGTKGLI